MLGKPCRRTQSACNSSGRYSLHLQPVTQAALQACSQCAPLDQVCGFLLKRYITSLGDKRRAVLEEILALMESGVIKPFNGRSFQLAEVLPCLCSGS